MKDNPWRLESEDGNRIMEISINSKNHYLDVTLFTKDDDSFYRIKWIDYGCSFLEVARLIEENSMVEYSIKQKRNILKGNTE